MMTTTRSTSLVELTKALSAFQGAIRSVPKRSVNPFYKSKYADLDAVWDMCRTPLSEHGLAVVQTPVEIDGKMYLETMLLHTSGESITAYLALNVKELTPQSVGSAITYARRYSMSAMLGISADEDDDGEKATPKGQQSAKTPAEPPMSDYDRGNREAARIGLAEEPIAPKPRLAAPSLTEAQQTRIANPPSLTVEQLRAMLKDEGMEWQDFVTRVLGVTWVEWVKRGGTPAGALVRWGTYKKDHPAMPQDAAARPAGAGAEAE